MLIPSLILFFNSDKKGFLNYYGATCEFLECKQDEAICATLTNEIIFCETTDLKYFCPFLCSTCQSPSSSPPKKTTELESTIRSSEPSSTLKVIFEI